MAIYLNNLDTDLLVESSSRFVEWSANVQIVKGLVRQPFEYFDENLQQRNVDILSNFDLS